MAKTKEITELANTTLFGKDQESFKKEYNEGITTAEIQFGYQFMTICVDLIVSKIKSQEASIESLRENVEKLSVVLLNVNDSEMSFGLDHLRVKLIKEIPQLSVNQDRLNPVLKKYVSQLIVKEIIEAFELNHSISTLKIDDKSLITIKAFNSAEKEMKKTILNSVLSLRETIDSKNSGISGINYKG